MKKILIIVLLAMTLCLVGCANKVQDGAAFLEEKKYEEAIEAFQGAIDKQKNLGEAYKGQALAYWELEKSKEAKVAAEKALKEGVPKAGNLYYILSSCAMEEENMQVALAHVQAGLALEGLSPDIEKSMKKQEIIIYEELKDWESAKEAIKEYVKKYPEDEEAKKEATFLETR